MVGTAAAGYGENPKTEPIEGDSIRKRNGMGGKREREKTAREDESLDPEDRPSKLSHALSVLRKRRIGVAVCPGG